MRIPFTNYDLRLSRRGIKFLKNGELVSFVDWQSGVTSSQTTPYMEQIYSTIANEFAKIDLKHIKAKGKKFEVLNDDLNYIVSERPNPLQTKYDFLFTMMYQLLKYGNALAFLNRDKNGYVTSISPVDVGDFQFGNGYDFGDGNIMLKYKQKSTNEILLVDYQNVIHLRLNPNDVFFGDNCSWNSRNNGLIDLIDSGLNALIKELKDAGTIRGIVKIGSSSYAQGIASRALGGTEQKEEKQKEIINRIKKGGKGGILVLDAGEEWQSLSSPFSTASTKQIDEYVQLLLDFNGINKAVMNGSASSDQMEVFFNKTIVPRIEQFIAEMNYKIFLKTSRTQGHRIEFYRNPFEYIPIDKAIDIAYKGAMDTTTNERRRLIYKLPPIENGDVLMSNKNFEPVDDLLEGGNENGN